MPKSFTPVSLGNSCEGKFQINRVMQYRRTPDFSKAAFRLMMAPPRRTADVFGWTIFDWQLTPFGAVCEYIERDFEGVFERDDLIVGPLGCAYNRRFKTHHLHEFEKMLKPGEVLTSAHIDRGYAAARELLEARAEAMRRVLSGSGPYLYVYRCEDIPNESSVLRLLRALRLQRPNQDLHILCLGREDEDSDLSMFEAQGLVTKGYLPRGCDKPADRAWEGDDDAWDNALAPFSLMFSNGDVVGPVVQAVRAPPKVAAAAPVQAAYSALNFESDSGWQDYPTQWRSLVWDYKLDQDVLPLQFVTPEAAWDYGAITGVLARPSPQQGSIALRMRAQSLNGCVGICIARSNGSDFLGAQIPLRPEDGRTELYFELKPGRPPASILVRNYGDEGVKCVVRIEQIDAMPLAALDPTLLAKVAASSEVGTISDVAVVETSGQAAISASQVYEPVSLGSECETKFQISRVLYFQKHPTKTQASLQLAMMRPNRGRPHFPWRLFDCQGTSVPSICEYLERDFRGVFEREDLLGCAEGVVHKTLGTNHLHEFEGATTDFSTMSPEEFLPAYEAARAQFEVMADRFREMLKQPGPYLYVHGCTLYPSEDEVWRLIKALSSRSPAHKFHILLMGYEGEYIDTEPFGGLVTSFGRPYREFKERKWNWWDVDYDVWAEALGQFRLGEHPIEPEPSAPSAHATDSPAPVTVHSTRARPSGERLRSFLSKMFGRGVET